MKVGIKYCGGCNEHYPRVDTANSIISKFPEMDFELAREDVLYDVILVVGGCSSCCADYTPFSSRLGIIKMWDLSQLAATEAALIEKSESL